MARRRITPEERAEWAEARRGLAAWLERHEETRRERERRAEARRARLGRLTFGMLGR
jgi:hypothetical protein